MKEELKNGESVCVEMATWILKEAAGAGILP
jgi:hypothetical protein